MKGETTTTMNLHLEFLNNVLAQRELEKRRSPLVQRFRPFGTGIF